MTKPKAIFLTFYLSTFCLLALGCSRTIARYEPLEPGKEKRISFIAPETTSYSLVFKFPTKENDPSAWEILDAELFAISIDGSLVPRENWSLSNSQKKITLEPSLGEVKQGELYEATITIESIPKHLDFREMTLTIEFTDHYKRKWI